MNLEVVIGSGSISNKIRGPSWDGLLVGMHVFHISSIIICISCPLKVSGDYREFPFMHMQMINRITYLLIQHNMEQEMYVYYYSYLWKLE